MQHENVGARVCRRQGEGVASAPVSFQGEVGAGKPASPAWKMMGVETAMRSEKRICGVLPDDSPQMMSAIQTPSLMERRKSCCGGRDLRVNALGRGQTK